MKTFDPTPWTRKPITKPIDQIDGPIDITWTNFDKARSCILQLKERGIDITKDYNDWTKLGFSLANLGEPGRALYHELSRINQEYDFDQCGKKFTELLTNANGSVAIGTIFKYCADHGIYPIKEMSLEIDSTISKSPATTALKSVLDERKKIFERMKHKIEFLPPLIVFKDQGAIWKNTINVITGQKGSHKSRLCEGLGGVILNPDNSYEWNGFKLFGSKEKHYLLYIDTERPVFDQFPFSLQKISRKAGYVEKPDTLDAISLIKEPRENRFEILKEYIERVRAKTKVPIVVIIDVGTDLTRSFNDLPESLKFIDYLNLMINEYDITIICVIHENPGTGYQKARGHLGTELGNKASTELRIGPHRGADGKPTHLIQLQFTKVRNGKPPEPTFLVWSDKDHDLILATPEDIHFGKDIARNKASVAELIEALPEILAEPLNNSDFAEAIKDRFDCGISTAKNRISELTKFNPPVTDGQNKVYRLRTKKDGKSTLYFLEMEPGSGLDEGCQS